MTERTMATGEGSERPAAPRVLLVEDDEGDALLVREILAAAGAAVTLVQAGSLRQAVPLLAQADCVLLDLGLPDSDGLDGLRLLLERRPGTAVVVLTGQADEHLGEAAVRAGAQDYLVKGHVTGSRLDRVIRYSVERLRAQETQRLLHEAQLSAREKTRLERGLLPVPLVTDPGVAVSMRYRPGGGRMLLGGDFYDLVEAPDGWLHAIVGDVCGRGRDEAALDVCLRVAWRTMILAGRPAPEILSTLHTLLEHERPSDKIFATLCALSVAPDRSRGWLCLAGHPPPLLMNLSSEFEATGAVIEIGPLPVVSGEESLLTAVFQNLLSNALKFRGADPPRIQVAARRDGDSWLFTVQDNGIGVEPEFAERIFVIFPRLHGRSDYPGTGIGLAMCRKIIEYHGGRIWLDTAVTRGSRFCFTLPRPVMEESTGD